MSKNFGSNDFFKDKPRETSLLILLIIFGLWQTGAAILALGLFCILNRALKIDYKIILGIGITTALMAIISLGYRPYSFVDLQLLTREGWSLNIESLKLMALGADRYVAFLFSGRELSYILGFPLFFTACFTLTDFIPASVHEKTLKMLSDGKSDSQDELSDKKIQKLLNKIKEEKVDGTVLGVSKYTGQTIFVDDGYVNQVVVALGTTGAGKSITLRRFCERAARKGYPLIFVNGKPTETDTEWLKNLAEKTGRPFYGFNCGNYFGYDCLSEGGFTELKDKIMTLKSEWSSDHYKSIAGDYLQAVFEVLYKSGEPLDLSMVINCLDYEELSLYVRKIKDKDLMSRVSRLKDSYKEDDIKGLKAHLNTLVYSELGDYFKTGKPKFSLSQAIKENAIVCFALPALRFPEFAKVLGKLVINDLKTVIDRNDSQKKIFAIFDEFSVFAGEQVLNLVNMGRGKGMHAVFGTQGISDLRIVSPEFESQMLNCANTIICHRLNDQTSAETIAEWAGTKDEFTVTAQLGAEAMGTGMGSVRVNRAFIVHPDRIKQELQVGDAFLLTKVKKFQYHKIKIKYS